MADVVLAARLDDGPCLYVAPSVEERLATALEINRRLIRAAEDAVVVLHEAGLHEDADRFELAAGLVPF